MLLSVLKRNGIVTVLLIALMSALRLFSPQFFWPAAIIVLVGSVVGFIWASRRLAETIGHIGLGVLVTLMVLVLGFFSLVVSASIPRKVVEYRYRAAGYEMRTGCNLWAAMDADISLFNLSNRVDELRKDSRTDTNELRRLQEEYVATKRRVEFLEADIRLRGHRHTFPGRRNASL